MHKEMEQQDQTDFVSLPCGPKFDLHKTAVLFGPVAPTWTGDGFCKPLVQTLNTNGYAVYVVDSIPLLLAHGTAEPNEVLSCYLEFVTNKFQVPDLLAGYAYGGTLAMALAPLLPKAPDVISVSGPGYANPALHRQLGALITTLKAGKLDEALALLAQSVAPICSEPSLLHLDKFEGDDPQHAISRMIAGFEFLLRLDVRAALSNFEGRLLAITGELSKLATKDTLGFRPSLHPQFTHAEIPGAGMRVLLEAQTASVQVLNDWINYEKENSRIAR